MAIKTKKSFSITSGKGFHLTFENGYTISVQWGPGNYGDNYNDSIADFYTKEKKILVGGYSSNEVEIAIIDPHGNLIPIENGETVKGWLKIDEVLKWINYTSNI